MKKKTEIDTEKELVFRNTLTHDKCSPELHGFCLMYGEDNNTKIVEHNGFGNLTDEDIQKFEQILNMLKFMKFVKESENEKGITRDCYWSSSC